jgi:hypothetical protein
MTSCHRLLLIRSLWRVQIHVRRVITEETIDFLKRDVLRFWIIEKCWDDEEGKCNQENEVKPMISS